MTEYTCPQAKVLSFVREGENAITRAVFDKLPNEPIAPAEMGEVELHRVLSVNGLEVNFESYNVGEKILEVGRTYEFHTWWVPWQLEIAQSDLHSWRKEEFRPSNAIETILEDGQRFWQKQKEDEILKDVKKVDGGWDHEHCGLCWKTISVLEVDEHVGYTDDIDWVCESCYEKYIASGFGKRLG